MERKNKKVIVPPIKSQGIKTKLIPWIMDLMPATNGRWIEPFLGTGVVAFNSGYKKAILNDSNPHIINFYKKTQSGEISPALMRNYLEIENSILSVAGDKGYDHYRAVKTRFNTDFSPYDFIFLSRAGFNGMMRFNKKGHWNIPFCKKPDRFAPSYVTKIVNQLSNVGKVIQPEPDWTFFNKSFADIIPMAQEGDVIYCDPPYYGRYVDYFNGWTEEDEELLFNLLSETKAKFVLSTWHHNNWRENEMIAKFWSKFNIVTKDHFYHSGGKAENRQTVVEALVCNFEVGSMHKHTQEKAKIPLQLSAF